MNCEMNTTNQQNEQQEKNEPNESHNIKLIIQIKKIGVNLLKFEFYDKTQ